MVKAPPSSGPITEEIPKTAPNRPLYNGLLARGMTDTIRIIAPFIMPAVPTPAIARPMMNAIEFGAAPHSADPISKTVMQMRKTYFGV